MLLIFKSSIYNTKYTVITFLYSLNATLYHLNPNKSYSLI